VFKVLLVEGEFKPRAMDTEGNLQPWQARRDDQVFRVGRHKRFSRPLQGSSVVGPDTLALLVHLVPCAAAVEATIHHEPLVKLWPEPDTRADEHEHHDGSLRGSAHSRRHGQLPT
jgi:hypothetical protein